jgi:hypothetical protein
MTKFGALALGLRLEKPTHSSESALSEEDDPWGDEPLDPVELEYAVKAVFQVLVDARNTDRYRFDPRVHRNNAVDEQVLWAWSRHLGVAREAFIPVARLLLASRFATLVPTGLSTLFLAARDRTALPCSIDVGACSQDNPAAIKSVVLQFVAACEEDVRARAARIRQSSERRVALDLIGRGAYPARGATSQLLHGRRILVVGERDQKPDGPWPGRDGAQRVASEIARVWDRAVR